MDRLDQAEKDESGRFYTYDDEEYADRSTSKMHAPLIQTVKEFIRTRPRKYILAQKMIDTLRAVPGNDIRITIISDEFDRNIGLKYSWYDSLFAALTYGTPDPKESEAIALKAAFSIIGQYGFKFESNEQGRYKFQRITV